MIDTIKGAKVLAESFTSAQHLLFSIQGITLNSAFECKLKSHLAHVHS